MSWINKNFVVHAFPLCRYCQWCLKPLNRSAATADHIVPITKGGSHRWDNLLISCYQCNHGRGNKRVITKKGVWINDSIRPHGPRWRGPYRDPKMCTVIAYWCLCHVAPDHIDNSGVSNHEGIKDAET